MGYLRPSICSRVVQNAGRVLLSGVSLGITQRIDGGRCLDAITRVWLGIYSALKVGKVEYIITYDPAQLSPEWSYRDLVSVSISALGGIPSLAARVLRAYQSVIVIPRQHSVR